MKTLLLLGLSPIRNFLKQTKGPKVRLLSLQNTTLHLARTSLINSMKLSIMDDPSSETVSSKYYEPCELSSLLNNSKNCLSFLHLIISSLSFYIEELTTLISEHNLTFDIFGVSETKLRLNTAPLNSVIIPGYNFEFTATQSSNGGTAIYIKKGLNYKLRKDLEIYKSKQLESTFVEVTPKNEKVVIGCIYIHPSIHGAFRIQ